MANFGETLRRERELRDISLREIADATKVNLRYLEALEQNRFDILPGGVFNKGFIRAYARFIGADGESLVDRYLQEIAEREARAQAAAGAVPGATPHAPGLHRPPEAPRRRTGPDPAPPVPAPTTTPAPAWVAPSIAHAETVTRPMPAVEPSPAAAPIPAARPAPAPRPAPVVAAQHAPIFEAEAAATGSNAGTRLVATTLWIAGAALIGFLGVWVIRGLRSASPAPAEGTAPSTSVPDVGGNEEPGTPSPGTAPAIAPDTPGSGQAPADTAATPDAAAANGPSATPPAPALGPVGPEATTGAEPAAGGQGHEPKPSLREDSIERPQRTGGGPQPGAAPPQTGAARPPREPAPVSIASAVSPPAPGVESRPAAPATAGAGRGAMEFRIEATAPVWVQVACDGDERLNQALQPGQGYSMRCLSFVRLSVTDIAAVRLTVNGGRCVPPGDRGARIEGFVIRAEDATAICPIQQGAMRGSR
jgi:cytoskeletal protein RodZ